MLHPDPRLRVRTFTSPEDYRAMIDYFHSGSDEFLRGMGVDRTLLPAREAWLERAWRDHQLPEDDPRRDRFFLAWLFDGMIVGHSSINRISWGEHACGHLHLWRSDLRSAGAGTAFFSESVSVFFQRFRLETLYVEPYADNPAPNRVLEKLGFTLIGQYRTVPGPINFEQNVNRYEMKRSDWETTGPASH